MKNTTIRGIPDEVYEEIQQQATRSRRSVNAQMVYILERGATPPTEAGRVVHHLNGDPSDNRPENLEIRDAD